MSYKTVIKKEVTKVEETEVVLSIEQYIADKVRTLREEKKMTIQDLAVKIGIDKISTSSIGKVESNIKKNESDVSFNFKFLLLIAEALEIDVMELFPYKEYYEAKSASFETFLADNNG